MTNETVLIRCRNCNTRNRIPVARLQDRPRCGRCKQSFPPISITNRPVMVTDKTFAGKPTLMFFGFTYCPDVCPTTLSELQGWMEALGPDADRLNYAFVSVDPERDTPDVMRDYVWAFDKRITPLTGSREQIDAMLRAYRVYAKRVELDDGDYTMDHSAAVYLMNADNKFVGTIAYGEAEENALQKLRRLIENAPASS